MNTDNDGAGVGSNRVIAGGNVKIIQHVNFSQMNDFLNKMTPAKIAENKKIEENNQSLFMAAQKGDIKMIRDLVDGKQADFFVRNKKFNDKTLLHFAASNGQVECVEYLIRSGINVNVKDDEGTSPLCNAAFYSNLRMVVCLVGNGADVFARRTCGWSVLQSAAFSGKLDCVQYLTEAGCNVNNTDRDGNAVIHSAAQNGHLHVVKYLVSKGANFYARRNDGWTIMDFVSFNTNNKKDLIKYFKKFGIRSSVKKY